MKKISVGLLQGFISNFGCLPNNFVSTVDKKTVIDVRNDLVYWFGSSGGHVNCDMLFDFEEKASKVLETLLPVVKTERLSKTQCMVKLNLFCKNFDNFHPINVYFIHKSVKGYGEQEILSYDPLPDVLIAKKDIGAEGKYQIKIPTKDISLDYLFISKLRENKYRTELMEKFPGLVFSTSSHEELEENISDGSDHGWTSSYGDYCFCDFVPNVVSEYRVLLSAVGEHLVYKRNFRNSDTYQQVCNGFNKDENAIPYRDWLAGLPCALGKEIHETINWLGDYGAVDLFITDESKWGIFEWSNQFGIYGNDPQEMIKLHKDYISQNVNRYFGKPKTFFMSIK